MITQAFIIACVVQFLHASTAQGMIFGIVSRSLVGLPTWLRKPLYECPTCMSIWWGPSIICVCFFAGLREVTTTAALIITITIAAGILAFCRMIIEANTRPCNCGKKSKPTYAE